MTVIMIRYALPGGAPKQQAQAIVRDRLSNLRRKFETRVGAEMRHISTLCYLTAAFIMASAAARADGDRNFTTTPIKHLVVIFQENISFDHYFGTYPNAQNNPG